MHAVNAYAEHSGALLLAEGIETPEHLRKALALGARYGQGWLFGRPSVALPEPLVVIDDPMPRKRQPPGAVSPFACLPEHTEVRRADKRLLIELSKRLEEHACMDGDAAILAAAFQDARFFTAKTAVRYRRLVQKTAFVCALGAGLPLEPVPGLRGARLDRDDPVRGEWDIVVVTPHFAAALLARDLGDSGADLDRTFEYALTYDRAVVTRAACALLERVAPALPASRAHADAA